MDLIIVESLYGLAAAIFGAIVGLWLSSSYFRRRVLDQANAHGRQAEEVLARLQELATRVAVDVDEHTTQVEEISDTLSADDHHQPGMIVDVVAKLIQTNRNMQEKLVRTEDRLREQAQQIQVHAAEARTDALTLLANRRAFDDELARRVAEFRRQQRTFSLVMADIDCFKKFNDTHGHQTGDEVLRGVARLLRRKLREMDLLARYGGEEFALILPGTSLDDACKTALRACEAVAKCPFRTGEQELRVTASFGVAEVLGNEDGSMLVARADKALYAAKQNGRQCAYRHDGETTARIEAQVPAKTCSPAERGAGLPPAAAAGVSRGPGNDKESAPPQNPPPSVELDTVSGLPSRTTFCQQVRNRTAEWKRGGPPFSVVLMEVDQYRQHRAICDRRAREAVILATSTYLAATVREMDTVSCYAPGCFALLLPTAGLADAVRVAERLREGFEQDHAARTGDPLQLTLSVSVVQVTERDDSIALLKRAEAALKEATRRGGNRSCYHDGERCAPISALLAATGASA